MMRIRSAEDWIAALDDILRRYQPELGHAPSRQGALNRDDAVAALRRLGFTPGEALLILRRKPAKA
jgi:hypothetical protein